MASVAADLPVAMETSRFAEVAVPVPVEGTFHYRVPEGMNLEVGHRVLVPFSGRKVTGFILGVPSPLPKGLSASKVKPILERLDVLPVLTPDVLALVRFASDYYLGPLGLALETALPPGLAAGSAQKLVITPAGRKALKAGKLPNELFLGPEEHDALTRSSRSGGARAGAIAPGLVRRLVEQGLIAERESLTTRRAVEAIELVERARAAEPNELSRAKARKKLYEALANGPVPVRRLAEELGAESLRSALRTLEKAGLVRRIEQPIPEGSSSRRVPEFPLSLTRDQTHALAEISKALSLRRGAFLLRGVTGSGKTEVYLRAIAAARAERRGAIVLVPEIALTSQLEARFRAHFGDDVVVLHSGLADGARRRGWARLLSGESGIALGARSAVWAPVRDLGVIVVDEEHDASFKQHTELRYNGRDLAMFRARREGAVTILGSATPSLEAVRLVEEGKLTELPLSSRATGRELPKVEVVDLSVLPRDEGEIPLFSRRLEEALREVVSKGEQAILFLNRRGFNTIVVCDECAAPRRCSRCSVTLIFHKRDARLVCHYCGHEEQLFAPCGSCGAKAMKPFGAGTERVATFVESTIPDAKVLRLDRDVTQNEGALAETLAAFRNR
ncbi:MAG: primosomal protein N', partial [Deltaproteobacteria bacterium]|nr:primosomal protein N' [Deltaproteobacteria bacterium]